MPDLAGLGRTAEREFLEVVNFAAVIGNKLRVEMLDGFYIDFWRSTQMPGRYAYHWERGHLMELSIATTISHTCVGKGKYFPQAFSFWRPGNGYRKRYIRCS